MPSSPEVRGEPVTSPERRVLFLTSEAIVRYVDASQYCRRYGRGVAAALLGGMYAVCMYV